MEVNRAAEAMKKNEIPRSLAELENERAEYELLFDIARTFDKYVELRC
jgi:hypothetical protein